MGNKLKQAIDQIPIPAELRQRSLSGIDRASMELAEAEPTAQQIVEMTADPEAEPTAQQIVEMTAEPKAEPTAQPTTQQTAEPIAEPITEPMAESIGASGKQRRVTRRKTIAAAIAGLVVLSLAVYNTQVIAAIQKMLQFVPGIGMVKEETVPLERYVLDKPVTVQIGAGKIVITGVMVDEQMTLVTMTGTSTKRLDHVKLVNSKGAEYTVESSLAVFGGSEWSSSFWHKGKLDLGEDVRLIVDGDPQTIISLTLSRAETYSRYQDMGETSQVGDVDITAIAGRVDGKARISLVSQHPDRFRIDDYGIVGYVHEDRKINVVDETGKAYGIEHIWGLSSPASEFYFPLAESGVTRYTVTIPEINVVDKDQIDITLPIPAEGETSVNRQFELAGFPVTITRVERIKTDEVRIYVDVAYKEDAPRSLHMFKIDKMSHMAKVSEQTSALEYVQFNIEPDAKQVKLTLTDPQIVIRGPWKFEFPVEKYFTP